MYTLALMFTLISRIQYQYSIVKLYILSTQGNCLVFERVGKGTGNLNIYAYESYKHLSIEFS